MRWLIPVILTALFVVGGYITFRFLNVPTSVDVLEITTFADLHPAKCTFHGGDFVGGAEGTMYIAYGNIRADYRTNIEGRSYDYHLVIQPGGYALWSDQGNSVPIAVPLVTEETASCSPWWISDNSKFIVPQDVELKEA